MNKNKENKLRTVRCRMQRLVRWFRDPFGLKELAGIKERMDYLHAEEVRTMQSAFKAFDQGDYDEYEKQWSAHLRVGQQLQTEVRDRLNISLPNDLEHQSRTED